MSNLVFVFPDKEVGGVATLFCRIVNRINGDLKLSHKAFIVDYKEGYSHEVVEEKYRILYTSKNLDVIVPDNSILIFQHSTVFRLYKNFHGKNLKCLFWLLHINNALVDIPFITSFIVKKPHSTLYKLFTNLPLYRESYVNFTNKIIEQNGLVLMENCQKSFISSTNSSVKINNCNIVPIYFKKINHQKNVNKDGNFLYLGRLVDFKVGPLLGIIKDLAEIEQYANKKLYVIGDGPLREKVKKHALKYNVKLVFLGTINIKKLKSIIENHKIEIAFSMGTSILECLNVGLKVIGVDINYKRDESVTYFTSDYFSESLGDYATSKSKKNLSEIIKNYEIDYNNINEIYNKKPINKLLSAARKTNLPYEFIKKYKSRYSFIYNIYYAEKSFI